MWILCGLKYDHTVSLQVYHPETGTSTHVIPDLKREIRQCSAEQCVTCECFLADSKKKKNRQCSSWLVWCRISQIFVPYLTAVWYPGTLSTPLSFCLAIQLMLLSNILIDSKDYINSSMMGKKYISVFCIPWMIQNKLWHCTFAKAWLCFYCLLLGNYI